jgi:hypothetical protein
MEGPTTAGPPATGGAGLGTENWITVRPERMSLSAGGSAGTFPPGDTACTNREAGCCLGDTWRGEEKLDAGEDPGLGSLPARLGGRPPWAPEPPPGPPP